MSDGSVQYGGFLKRLGAILIDLVFMLPLVPIYWIGASHFRLFQVYWIVICQLFGLVFSVYLVKRFGGTPGKLAMNLRIRKVNLEPVTYREALLRYLPEAVLSLGAQLGIVLAVIHMTDAEYFSIKSNDRIKHLTELAPAWTSPLTIANTIWFWGELLVLLTNDKRRALHDFIAGTVVIVKQPTVKPEKIAVAQPAA